LTNKLTKFVVLIVLLAELAGIGVVCAGEWNTEIDFDYRYFRKPAASVPVLTNTQLQLAALFYTTLLNAGVVPDQIATITPAIAAAAALQAASAGYQGNNEPSVVIQPSYYNAWNGKTSSFSFKSFFRWDGMDDVRTHADIREMVWKSKQGSENYPWNLRVGIDKVFWGAAESQHLIDVINQTDSIENINNESKLGQPMVRATIERSWGTLDVFVLPYFRERTYSGNDGRLRPLISFATLPVAYQSTDKQNHVDFALRWSKSFGNTDVGVSQFIGTNRDPRVDVGTQYITTENPAGLYLSYDQMEQTSIDVTSILGDWIAKLEALHRTTDFEHHYAYVTGVEYTFNGVFNTAYDANTFLEYNYDSRGQTAATYQSDVFAGLRLNLNDENSTQIKLGVLTDTNDSTRSTRLQMSRRLNGHWTALFEGQWFNSVDTSNPINAYRQDSYLQATLARYF
jgi:hypothetical protein